MKSLWCGLILVSLAGAASAQTVKAGVEAWQRNDPARAVSIWKPLAERGDADAQFNLGQAYRMGRGVSIDLAQAQGWFERAARQGHVDSATSLGLMLFQNGNRIAGMRWLKAAADAGEARALLVYGTALFNGDGVPADPVLAYAYVSRAAAQGLAPAKETLAQMDAVLPLAQRQRGTALAQSLAKAKPAFVGGRGKHSLAPTIPAPAPKSRGPERPKPLPAPVVATAAPAAASHDGRWRIQLGAFGQRSSAEALFRRLSGGPLAGRQPYFIPVGAITRLQAGPFESRAAASAACAALTRLGQPCFPVEAR